MGNFAILDEVVDDGIIMEVEEDKILARVRMQDETEVTNQQQAEQMFQKATQTARQKHLSEPRCIRMRICAVRRVPVRQSSILRSYVDIIPLLFCQRSPPFGVSGYPFKDF